MIITSKQKRTLFFLLAALFFGAFSLSPAQAGIVPCGGANDPCTLCHLIVGVKNLVDWGTKILVIMAIAAIVISGILYIISSGSSTMMTAAKNGLTYAISGFAIFICAWLIVNTVIIWLINAKPDLGVGATNWYTFNCNTQSNALIGATINSGGNSSNNSTNLSAQQQAQIQSDCNQYCDNGGAQETGTDTNTCKSKCIATKTAQATATQSAVQNAAGSGSCGVVSAGQSMMGWTYSQANREAQGSADCSSFARRSFVAAGCKNPGNATNDMYQNGQAVQNQSSLKAGDIIVYRSNDGSSGHAAVCQNNGCTTIMAASSGRGQVVTQNSGFMFDSSKHQPCKVLPASQYCPSGSSGASC